MSIFTRQPEPTRQDLRRAQRLRVASTLEEINRADLQFGRFDMVLNTRTGGNYKIIRGEVADAKFTPAVAYYHDSAGDVVFLERHQR